MPQRLAARTGMIYAVAVAAFCACGSTEVRAGDDLDYGRDIRPILSDNCFQCHGPDEAAREAGLRLDTFDGATALREGGTSAIVPGDSSAGLLMHRITSTRDSVRMPPVDSNRLLTEEQIDLLRRWIESGAEYSMHWSFIAPARPHPPRVRRTAWPVNHIDSFILARLEDESLAPSAAADRATLLRRVTLDLTGLPPTIDELDAFLTDDRPGAYERVIDRLLASPHYGEHMARYWLDASRYGDTHGLHLDNRRSVWRWRDWVIDAFNENKRFDEFTIEQLAGDLLPDPSLDQLIATGFNRNHVTTSEGGSIDDEYHVKYAVDRTETMATVWLGLTAGCAVCHDHKYDPISQREFYQLYAFFNNIDQPAMDGNRPDTPPVILAPTEEQQANLASMQAEIDRLRAQVEAPDAEADAAQAAWEEKYGSFAATRWSLAKPVAMKTTHGAILEALDDGSVLASGPNPPKEVYDVVLETDALDARLLRLEVLTHPSMPLGGHGRFDNSNIVLSEIEAEAVSVRDPERRRSLKFIAAAADHEQANREYWIEKTIDGVVDATNGWATEGHVRVEDRVAMYVTAEPFGYEGGTLLHVKLRHESDFVRHTFGRFRISVGAGSDVVEHLSSSTMSAWRSVGPFGAESGRAAFDMAFGPEADPTSVDLDATYAHDDGERAWVERTDLVDGEVHMLEGGDHVAMYFHRVIDAPTSRTMTMSFGSDDAIRVWLNGVVLLDAYVLRPAAPNQNTIDLELRPGRNELLVKIVNNLGGFGVYSRRVRETGRIDYVMTTDLLAKGERTDEEDGALRDFFRRRHNPEMRALYESIDAGRTKQQAYRKTLPTTLISKEREERRPAYVLRRGEYDQPSEEVPPGVPAVLPPMPDDAPPNRLGLARWLTDPSNPLTARVIVNRIWQQHFGVGLVKTSEDFGAQGSWPSHPELLDWLAREFIESGWDVKHMHRLLVSSATYRQSSAIRHDLDVIDPENRLLARGPRFRMDAEMIRDQALAASGLLVRELGGPPVKPTQPSGLWKAVAYPDSDTNVFMADSGEALYRRSLYTFWKRTSPPPNMRAFDAPNRESCTVRRSRTNSPMQSLVVLNDPQFVEAARGIAERVLHEAGPSTDERIAYAMQLVVGRSPRAAERGVLRALLEDQLIVFRQDPTAAGELLMVGQSPVDETLDPVEYAAWTVVASTLLGLDETVTKG